jgi:hypothetical protein
MPVKTARGIRLSTLGSSYRSVQPNALVQLRAINSTKQPNGLGALVCCNVRYLARSALSASASTAKPKSRICRDSLSASGIKQVKLV